jgi:hypothetical protein
MVLGLSTRQTGRNVDSSPALSLRCDHDSPPPSIRSAPKEFFRPLTIDSRANFFAVHRKESEEFGRGYGKKCDGDLNTSLIFLSRKVSI